MATTSNTYTGNGTNKLFSITFPYIETSDIDVYLNGTLQTITTQYTFANATTIEFVTAPANGATVLLNRSTDDTALQATFFPGSSIKAADLNDNFDQALYIAQETANQTASALTTSAAAVTTANAANTTANGIAGTANTALTNANAAVVTANTASSNATAAVSTANTALSTANTASTNASTAVSTANTANTNATNAVNTANTANANASAAISAVSAVVVFSPVAAVANIPSSPTNGQGVQVNNSTGIESFTPLANIPAGFVGDSGLNVKIQYTTTGSTWNWISYDVNDSDSRYLKRTGGTLTGAVALSAGGTSTTAAVDNNSTNIATTAYVVGQAGASNPLINGTAAPGTSLRYARQDHVHPTDTTRAPLASPTFTGTVTIPAGASISGFAPLASPTFTGTPAVPTATAGTNTTQIASTAFVATSYAPLASPALTGTPTAPTATAGTNTTQIATTAFASALAATTLPLSGGTMTGNITFVSTQPQVCKAWVNFNGTGTVAIRASYNVSSITDNNTGDYTVNFTSALADANYAINITAKRGSLNEALSGSNSSTAPAAGSCRIITGQGSFVLVDGDFVNVAVFK
jgi:hypothetical protein